MEEVRERIVASALRNFAEKGYAGTSLREIAEAAHTTKPMIYYYFNSKEGLYVSTLNDRLQAFADAIDHTTGHDSAPRERLRSFCEAYLDYFISQEPHCAFVVREVFGLGADITNEFGRSLDQRVRTRLQWLLQDGIERDIFRACDVEMAAIAIMGILNMFILRRIFGGAELERDAAVAQVVDFYLDGLATRADAAVGSLR